MGTNQYDYLRRLSFAIKDLDERLRREGRGGIKAFGILGSDYYDKLLILQALKEHFPSHLYFTTDVDARYLDAKVFRWTRNLVIASTFGLTTDRAFATTPDSRKALLPPFRSSYQTGLYLATKRTLDGTVDTMGSELQSRGPRIFEVGYGQFFELNPDIQTKTEEGSRDAQEPTWRIWEQLWRILGAHWMSRLALIAITAFGLVLLVAPSFRERLFRMLGAGINAVGEWPHRVQQTTLFRRKESEAKENSEDERSEAQVLSRQSAPRANNVPVGTNPVTHGALNARPHRHRAILLTALAYLTIGAYLGYVILLEQEPFAWFGGVSIWPSEIVRLLAGLIAVVCLIRGWRRVRDTDTELECCFELKTESPGDDAHRSPRFRTWYYSGCDTRDCWEKAAHTGQCPPGCDRMAEHVCKLFGDRRAGYKASSVDQVAATVEWRHYSKHASLGDRFRRVLPATLVFWILSFVVLYGFGDPLSPHRGSAAYWFSTLNGMVFFGFPFLLLLFAAMDEALLCGGLLRRLGKTGVLWPDGTYAAGCQLSPDTRGAVNHWLTLEFIARRTSPAAHVIHLPFIVILFVLLSLSTRFDNWDTLGSVLVLVAVSVSMALVSSILLRRTAQRIRQRVLDDLTEEVSGIEYVSAKTHAEKLRNLVDRIKAIQEGAYSKWYNEPVVRALAWVLTANPFYPSRPGWVRDRGLELRVIRK